MRSIIGYVAAALAISGVASAHGNHGKARANRPEDADWATVHMQEEHHIDEFDAGSFFALHDYDNSGTWTPDEVRRTYGLEDESTDSVSEAHKQQIVRDIFALFDPTKSGVITRDGWMREYQNGRRLPDFGLGPGHHGDMEWEYEIHHFEKFHGEDAKLEDLTHPEDIEHFRRHDEVEDAENRIQQLEKMVIVDANIPAKFRRPGH